MTMFQPALDAEDVERLVAKCQRQLDIEALAYLESRNIHEKTIAHFALGFEDHKIGFSVAQISEQLAGRIIFPIRDRDGRTLDLIGRALDDREPKYKTLLGVEPLLFNEPVLGDAEEVIIAGGLFDVLSLSQVSLAAVAVPDCYAFAKEQAALFAGKRVFVCYGNDYEGRRENERVAHLLEDVADDVYIVTLPEGIKDINDLYVRAENAHEVFVSLIHRAIQTKQESGIEPDSHFLTAYNEEYLKRHRGQTTGIPTGLPELDDLLLGGFRTGLYVMRGGLDVDKTTLVRQMADHAAFLDCPVAFFTWESSAFELWANSLSRLLDCSVRDVLLGNIEPERVKAANERYEEFAAHIWTLEGTMDTSSNEIADYIKRIAQTIGKMPVVFLDSLHRISYSREEEMLPSPERSSLVVHELHHVARELHCPLILTARDEGDGGSKWFDQALEAAADVLVDLSLLRRSEEVGPLLCFDVRKNRNGDTGRVEILLEDAGRIFKSRVEIERKRDETCAEHSTA